MDVSSTHTYAAAPDTVFAMMTDPDVLTEKYTTLGHRDVEITGYEEGDDGTVRVSSRRSVPMDVPGFAKKFLKPMNTVEQTDDWDAPDDEGARWGSWEVSARGVPVSASGTLRITPGKKQGTTVVEVDGEVTSSVPLVGGKLAGFVGGDVQRTLVAEEEFNDDYLARNAG